MKENLPEIRHSGFGSIPIDYILQAAITACGRYPALPRGHSGHHRAVGDNRLIRPLYSIINTRNAGGPGATTRAMNFFSELFPRKLGAKINAILVLYFVFALSVILLTLYVARQLEGEGAAINVAGSERMLIYDLTFRLHQMLDGTQAREGAVAEARRLTNEIEQALYTLETGDPDRPLFLPREQRIRDQMLVLKQEWRTEFRPRIDTMLTLVDASELHRRFLDFDRVVRSYVPKLNDLVLMVEQSNARNTFLMFVFQNVLVGFALLGTILLIYLFTKLVIEPVEMLRAGIDRMTVSDFDVRLPVQSQDEFGELAVGFNHMADHLKGLYGTLEQRVAEKTHSVEERNRELALLYDIAAFLGEHATLEAVCNGVLFKLRNLLGAPSGVVRLVNATTSALDIAVNHNMPDSFLASEAHLPMGACLCCDVAVSESSITHDLNQLPPVMTPMECCRQNGFAAITAVPIRSKKHVIGVLNLFFRERRTLSQHEIKLLEAIGQHLGVAIENLRLVLREKEMAVSEERNLLAQELHDSIAQSLAFLNIEAQMLQESLQNGQTDAANEELARIREGIQESYDDVRELLVHFRIRVDHANLEDAIRSTLEKFEGQTGISAFFSKQGETQAPPATSLIQILHILQEALSNVRKHAKARAVTVEMRGGKELRISIRDDGLGFEPDTVAEQCGASVGIGIMRERAHRIGARLEVESAPGRGACVTLALPR
ncbi:MAG: histidine kinase [Gammaproteobacteria bacterium]